MLTVTSAGRAWTAGRCPSRRGCSAGGSVPSPSASHAWGTNHGRPRARTCRQSPRLNCLQRARRSSSLSRPTRGETATRPSPGRVDVGTSTRADQLSRTTSAGQLCPQSRRCRSVVASWSSSDASLVRDAGAALERLAGYLRIVGDLPGAAVAAGRLRRRRGGILPIVFRRQRSEWRRSENPVP